MLGDKPLIVVVDYIQRATAGTGQKPSERIAAASSMLAEIAGGNTTTIALSQFTTDKGASEPLPIPKADQSSWAKEIHNDACDFIIYHRPLQESCEPLAVIQMAKSRYGRLAHVWALGSPSNRFEAFHAPGSATLQAVRAQYPDLDLALPDAQRMRLNTPELRP